MRSITVTLALGLLLVPVRAGDDRPAGGEWHALLVGCTEYAVLKERMGAEAYKAARIELKGPANDVAEMRRTLLDLFQVPEAHIKTLVGWPEQASERPTYGNIVAELDRLAKSVKKGDRVLIHMAGHGSQVPDTDGDEMDGLDEVFLPADVSVFDVKAGTVPSVLTDDEMGRKVRAIRDAGAMVWLLMDCCHSGTMVRAPGDPSIRMREVDPEVLGVPASATRGAPAEGDESLGPAEIDKKGLGGIVAMYGAQSYRPAPEMPLPRTGPREQATQHGLLTYMVLSQLRRAGGSLTFAELQEQVLAGYAALPYNGTVPLAEGDLRLRVFGDGRQAGPVLLVQSEGDKIALNAGQLAGIVPGTVLAVYEPGKLGDGKALLGGVEVVSTDPIRSVCHAVELDGRKPPQLESSWRCPAQVRRWPTGDRTLKVAAIDPQGQPLPREKVPKAALDVFAANGSMFALASAADAKWSLVVDGDAMWLEPGQGAQALRFTVTGETLLENLQRIFRAENLMFIAGTPGAAGALPAGLEVRMFRIEKEGPSELRSGAVLEPGDRIKFVLKNGSGRILDVTLLHIDAHYGVSVVWPDAGGARLTAADKAEKEIGPLTVNDKPLGTERLLIVAVPRAEGDSVIDLTFLEQKPLDVLSRGPEAGGVAALLREMSFGGEGVSRGFDEEPASMAMSMLVWRTEWGGLRGPAAGAAKGVVLRGNRDVIPLMTGASRDAWRPASDPTVLRGGDLSALYAQAAPAIVVVRSRLGTGTGFLIDADHILTNHHVAGTGFEYTKGGRPQVMVHRGSLGADGVMALQGDPLPAEVVCWDTERDLALLRVAGGAAAFGGVRPIPFADAGPKPGQPCVMIGHPASGLLWTLRDGIVSQVGQTPRDMVDTVMQCLAASADQRAVYEQQLAAVSQVRIALSNCQGNHGDSGGPLLDEKGRLLAVTYAIPRDAYARFTYHIHLDEVRAFLAGAPKAGAPLPPEAPDPWETGPRVGLGQSRPGAAFDILLAEQPDDENPRLVLGKQIFIDVDENTAADGSPETAQRMLLERSFDAEVVVHILPDRNIVFYDTENDGTFDLILIDFQKDGRADAAFQLRGGKWIFEPDASMEMLSTGYLGFLDRDSRRGAMMKFRILTQ